LFTDYPTSHTVENVIRFACADCHSNHTEYPWYAKIQPVSMWIDHHVDEGKEHFNIDAWNTYSRKQQKHKIEECIEVIEEGEMPMKGYVKMHERANLTALQKKEITLWAKGLIDSMERRN
jgi:DNA replicative helicase MCM subunit Mcm2 (Cdc46/Mcm family)